MKTLLCGFALAVLLAAAAGADGTQVTVSNPEPYRFWYVLDPEDFASVPPDDPTLIDTAAAYLTADGGGFPFESLESGLTVVFVNLPEGLHYLLGFFESDLLEDLPVQLVGFEVSEADGDFGFEVLSVPELFMVSRGIGRLAGLPEALAALQSAREAAASEEPAVAEEAVVEAAPAEATPAEEAVVEEAPVEEAATEEATVEAAAPAEPPQPEVLASFSEYYDPVYFTRESRDGFSVLPIASSRAWGKPGTRLSLCRGVLSEGTATLTLRSEEGFAPSVSFFLYVFPERSLGDRCEFTFEARPDLNGRSVVVLWQEGSPLPRLVGSARTEGGEFSWTLDVNELPGELAAVFGPSTTFDLTTAWLDEASGTWEEFYFTTFAVVDLTR